MLSFRIEMLLPFGESFVSTHQNPPNPVMSNESKMGDFQSGNAQEDACSYKSRLLGALDN